MTDTELAECRLDEIGTQKDIGLYWKARCDSWLFELSQMRDFARGSSDFMLVFEPWLDARLKEFDSGTEVSPLKKLRLDYWDRLSFISAYFDPETVRQELIRFCRTEFAQEIEDSSE